MAVVLAGVLVVGGAVVALRLAGGMPDPNATPPPPPPTVVKPFSAQGVLAPTPGPPPARPGRVTVAPGPHRLRLTWGVALPGGHDPAGAVGYAVHWNGNDLLVAQPYAELDGLAPGVATQVQVRSIDAYGQRSAPVTVTGRAQRYPPAGADDALVDDFTGPDVPDPRRWQLSSDTDCAQDGPGTGPDSARLVVLDQCGQPSVTLGARTPFRLRPATDGELDRFTVDTDAPGETGELDLDLVPGQVTEIDGSANDMLTPTKPGVAASDADLPRGTIRVRIVAAADSAGPAADTVQVAAGPGTPTVPVVARQVQRIPPPMAGISVRWAVVLRTDGVEVLRDGVLVGSGNVVPGWTTAKALIEFSGSSLDQEREHVDMIGFGGAPASAPQLVRAPLLVTGGFPVVAPGSTAHAIDSTDTGPGSALLRMTVLATPNNADSTVTVDGRAPKFGVRLGTHTYLATAAVPGTPLLPEVRYSLVARIPASALTGVPSLPVDLVVDAPTSYPTQLVVSTVDLDIVARPGDSDSANQTTPPITQPPQLAALSAQVLDASGNRPPQDKPLPNGRAVLDVTMDDVATQRTTGAVAGLAGFVVLLDGRKLVAVPTAAQGPGLAGDWRTAFATAAQRAGTHTLDVLAYSTQPGVPAAEALVTFQLGG